MLMLLPPFYQYSEHFYKDSLERKLCNLTPVENIVELQKERDFYQEAYRKISERTGINDEIVSQDQVTTLIEERNQARNSILTLERKLEESIANLKGIAKIDTVAFGLRGL
jgi:hypothetical protein